MIPGTWYWPRLIGLAVVVLGCCFCQAAEQPTLTPELGERHGQPIDSGFAFVDGRYVEAPYVVSRQGPAVYVNDVMVFHYKPWPIPDLRVDKDPGSPKDLDPNTSWEDFIGIGKSGTLFSRQHDYLLQHFPNKEVETRLVEWLRAAPCVESARQWRPGGIEVVMKCSDKKERLTCSVPGASISRGPPSVEAIIRDLEWQVRRFDEQLREASMWFISTDYHAEPRPSRQIAEDFPLGLRILRSDEPDSVKMLLLAGLRVFPGRGTRMVAFVRGFETTPQFDTRLQAAVRQARPSPEEAERLAARLRDAQKRERILTAKITRLEGALKGESNPENQVKLRKELDRARLWRSTTHREIVSKRKKLWGTVQLPDDPPRWMQDDVQSDPVEIARITGHLENAQDESRKEWLEKALTRARKKQQENLAQAEAYRQAVQIWRKRHGEGTRQ